MTIIIQNKGVNEMQILTLLGKGNMIINQGWIL